MSIGIIESTISRYMSSNLHDIVGTFDPGLRGSCGFHGGLCRLH